ncbi:hypothetical protein ACE6H2_010539 [Prunus campanulata]
MPLKTLVATYVRVILLRLGEKFIDLRLFNIQSLVLNSYLLYDAMFNSLLFLGTRNFILCVCCGNFIQYNNYESDYIFLDWFYIILGC